MSLLALISPTNAVGSEAAFSAGAFWLESLFAHALQSKTANTMMNIFERLFIGKSYSGNLQNGHDVERSSLRMSRVLKFTRY